MLYKYFYLTLKRGKFTLVVVALMALAFGVGYYAGKPKSEIYSIVNSVRNLEVRKPSNLSITQTSQSVLNISNFYFIHNPKKICFQRFQNISDNRTIISVVHSDRKNFKARAILRRTHGSVGIYRGWYVQVVFSLGMGLPDEPKTIGDLVEQEAKKYGDILLGNFVDTNRSLGYKELSGYQFAAEFCQAKFYLKSEDNSLVNIFHAIEFLSNETIQAMDKTFYYCRPKTGALPIRNQNHTSAVTKEEYSKDVYPDHCSFGVYLTGIGTVRKILTVRAEVPYLPTEAFVSGVLRERANEKETVPINTIKIIRASAFYNGRVDEDVASTVDEIEGKKCLGVIDEKKSPEPFCSLWSLILNSHRTFEIYPSYCNSLVPTEFA